MARHHSTPRDSNKETTARETETTTPVDASATVSDDATVLQARVDEAEDRYLRTLAEMKNMKRRHHEDAERIRDTATRDLVLELLPVIDDLERALAAAKEAEGAGSLYQGVELVLNKFLASLKRVGVERLPGVGQPFDPEFHEAAMRVEPTPECPAGTITNELRVGYQQHGHVIRPGLVAVAHE